MLASTLFTLAAWKICDTKWLRVCVCVYACLVALFVTQRCQVAMQMQDCLSMIWLWSSVAHLGEAADAESGGWSVSEAPTFTATVGGSRCGTVASSGSVAQRCQKWAIVLNLHTCCLSNDSKKSSLVCYLKPDFNATNLSHCQFLCEGVHHCNQSIAVIKSSSASRDVPPM